MQQLRLDFSWGVSHYKSHICVEIMWMIVSVKWVKCHTSVTVMFVLQCVKRILYTQGRSSLWFGRHGIQTPFFSFLNLTVSLFNLHSSYTAWPPALSVSSLTKMTLTATNRQWGSGDWWYNQDRHKSTEYTFTLGNCGWCCSPYTNQDRNLTETWMCRNRVKTKTFKNVPLIPRWQ